MSRVLRIVVRGRVQGVGFRYHTEAAARRLGISGWVRNLPGGEVEVLARVDDAQEAALLAEVREGPPGARVSGVQVTAGDAEACPATGFRIRA